MNNTDVYFCSEKYLEKYNDVLNIDKFLSKYQEKERDIIFVKYDMDIYQTLKKVTKLSIAHISFDIEKNTIIAVLSVSELRKFKIKRNIDGIR